MPEEKSIAATSVCLSCVSESNTFSDDEEDFLTCGDDELHERFLRLKKLYEDDLITEEEYEQKKEELLEEL